MDQSGQNEQNENIQQKPKKKKRFSLIQLIGIILIIIALVLMLIASMSGKIMKTAVEKGGTYALKVPVKVDEVELGLLSGKVEMENLTVANPEGYQHDHLMSAGQIEVKADIGSMMSDTVIVEKILFDEMNIVVEQKGLTNNLNQVLKNLPKKDQEPEPEEKEKPGKKVKVNELEMTNISVKVKPLPLQGKADTITFKLAPIKMTDLGSDAMSVAKLTAKIMTALAVGIATEGAGQLPKEMFNSISGTLKEQGLKAIDVGSDAVKKGADVGESVIEGAGEVGKKATDAIKGLFGGQDKK